MWDAVVIASRYKSKGCEGRDQGGLAAVEHFLERTLQLLPMLERFRCLRAGLLGLQGYLAHKTPPPAVGPPKVPRHKATVGSYEGGVSYERGTPVGFGVQGVASRVWGAGFVSSFCQCCTDSSARCRGD